MLGKSEIRFLPHGGRRVAYEIRGDGPPLVAPAWWVSHLELDWQSADFRRFWDEVADGYTLIRKRNKAWLIGICTSLGVLLVAIVAVTAVFILFVLGFGDPGGMADTKEPGQVDMPFDGLGEDVALPGRTQCHIARRDPVASRQRPILPDSNERTCPMRHERPGATQSNANSSEPVVEVLSVVESPPLPAGADATTVLVTLPPGSAGSPPHRHPGPAFGYGGDVIHY